jgi:PST family polysaccharide transporter
MSSVKLAETAAPRSSGGSRRRLGAFFGSHEQEEGLGRRSLRGGVVLIVARGVNAVVQIGSVLFLARLLTPEDYGLVAMVAALTAFAPALVDLGTRDAVAQRTSISEAEVSALFWLTVGVGCTCALVISGAAPLIAGFYREPRLTAIAVTSSLTFVLLGLTAQHQGLLRRALMFRKLAMIEVVANVLSASGAVTMAYVGFGYWALVTRPITLCFLTAVGTWWCCRWLPGVPALTSGVWQMVTLGLNQSGFVVTDFVARNSDRVAVGRGLGARTLGLYQNALFVYDQLLDVLVHPLHQVAVSSLSKLQHDLTELRRAWAKALSAVAFCAMPAFGILAITSGDLIVFVLGDKWVQTGALLSVLALRGMAHSVERTLGWLHVAAGRTDRWLRWGVVATCVQLGALFCGLPFGPFGVVWAHVLSMYVLFVPAIAYAGRPVGIGARDVIAAIGPQFVSALAAAGLGFALHAVLLAGVGPIERMAVLVVVYLATYLALVVGVFRVTGPVQVGVSLVKEFLPGSPKAVVVSRLPVGRE